MTTATLDSQRSKHEQFAERVRELNRQAADDPTAWIEYLLDLERASDGSEDDPLAWIEYLIDSSE